MFLVLQHPFADLRGFIGQASARLSRPAWPLASPQVDFIRSSGIVRSRRRGGVEEWAGEEAYGDASRALKFPDRMSRLALGHPTSPGFSSCIFRRFLSEGIVARLEVGLKLDVCESPPPSTPSIWTAMIRDCLLLDVRIPNGRVNPHVLSLVEAGDPLSQHYLHATTNRRASPPANVQPWWFAPGNPTLIVERSATSPFARPPHTRHVLRSNRADVDVFFCWLQLGRKRCATWFLSVGKGDRTALRKLRIHLLRLHAERECLRHVLVCVNDGRLDLVSDKARCDAVQQYLNDSLRTIEKTRRYGLPQSAMFEAAQEALGIALEGQGASLNLMRRQVATKIEGYIRRSQNTATVINNVYGDQMNTNIQLGNVQVQGDFNVVTAQRIQDSFNKAASSGASAELKEKLKELTVEVANLAKELPPDQAETVTKDLETLTTEAISKTPRKAWYELSADGLLEAAKTVADMAAPVTTAVKAVLALLT